MSNVGNVQQARDRVVQMARQIEDLSRSAAPPDTFFPEFLRTIVGALNARGGAVWTLETGSRIHLVCEIRYGETGIRDSPQSVRLNDRLLSEVLATGQAAVYAPDDSSAELPANCIIVLAALQIGDAPVGVVEIFQRPDAPRDARAGYLQFVEQMTGYASRYLERRKDAAPVNPAKFLGDFEQFALQLQRGRNVNDVAMIAVNDGRQLLGCDRVSVAVHKGAKTSIAAVSGQDRVNARANLTRAMAAIAARVAAMREPLTFSGRVDHLAPQIEKPLAEFIQESGSRMVRLVPLYEPEPLVVPDASAKARRNEKPREIVGCLVVEQIADSRPSPQLEAHSDMIAEHVGAALAGARRTERIFLLRVWEALGRGLEWFHGRKLAKTLAVLGAVLVVAAMLALVPWDYRVLGEGKLMPIDRQQVYAPENGDVTQLEVEGGEPVEKDALLLVLVNEQLQAELADARSKVAQSQQAVTSYDAEFAAADRQGDDAARTRATASRRKAEIEAVGYGKLAEILEARVNSLSVKAPKKGTVASFQLQQLLQNRPVQQGEMLLEVMDETGPWRLELEVEGSRMGHILDAFKENPDAKLRVEFIPATATESTFVGVLERKDIATRSAVSQDRGNVFEMHVAIDNDQIPTRRIGAEVRAKISCGKRSLGYVLFGDVIEFLRQRLWL